MAGGVPRAEEREEKAREKRERRPRRLPLRAQPAAANGGAGQRLQLGDAQRRPQLPRRAPAAAAGTERAQVAAGTGLGAASARTAGPRVSACDTEEKAESGGGGSDGARERRGNLLTERGEPVSERDPNREQPAAEPSRERRVARGSIGARRGGGAGPGSSRCRAHAAHRAGGRVRAAMCSVRSAHKQAGVCGTATFVRFDLYIMERVKLFEVTALQK